MLNPMQNAGVFLIQTLFDLYILVVMLRLFLQILGISYYNPVAQFVVKLTNPILNPLRKVLPTVGMLDIPIIVFLLLLQMIKISIIVWLQATAFPHLGGLLIWAFADLLKLTINIFFYAILIMVILSWVNPTLQSPITDILYRITEPLMQPARRLIPPISGFDISPIPVLIGLQLIIILLIQPLLQIGISIALTG